MSAMLVVHVADLSLGTLRVMLGGASLELFQLCRVSFIPFGLSCGQSVVISVISHRYLIFAITFICHATVCLAIR